MNAYPEGMQSAGKTCTTQLRLRSGFHVLPRSVDAYFSHTDKPYQDAGAFGSHIFISEPFDGASSLVAEDSALAFSGNAFTGPGTEFYSPALEPGVRFILFSLAFQNTRICWP